MLHERRGIGERRMHAPDRFLLRIRLRRPEGFRQSPRVAGKGAGNHLNTRKENKNEEE